ncbi:MAG: plasmid recombination protein, partial [Prevotella sp.]|nr:plasmid recombination protein [Prevotella sp.]
MSTTAKQVMDIKTSKGIAQSSNEQLRRWTENGWEQAAKEGNYDRSREHLNFEIARGGIVQTIDKEHTLSQRMAEILAARGIADPNKGLDPPKYRTVVNIIFGGSRDRMRELAFGQQEVNFEKGADNAAIRRMPEIEQWAKDIYDFACGKWGEENIVSFIVHLDEQNPHIHCSLLPLDQHNKFAFKKLFSGKDKLEFKQRTLALHDELAKVNEKWGLGRGESVAETKARHRSTEEYRRWLTSECSTLEEDIENHRKFLADLQKEIAIAERKAKSFTTMIANLTAEKENIEHQLTTLRGWLDSGEEDSEVLARKIGKLEWQLSQTEEKLAARQVQLAQTEQQ